MSSIDNIFDFVDSILNSDGVNLAFDKCSRVLSAVSYKSSVSPGTLIQLLLVLLAMGAMGMVYLSPHFKDVVLRVICIIYPVVKTLDTLEGDDPVLLKAWLSYWLVYALLRIARRVCKLDQSRLPYICFVEVAFFIWL